MKSGVPFLYITCLFIILYKLQILYQRNKYDCMETHFPLYSKFITNTKRKNIDEIKLFIQICIASNSRIAFGTDEFFFFILQLFRTWTHSDSHLWAPPT